MRIFKKRSKKFRRITLAISLVALVFAIIICWPFTSNQLGSNAFFRGSLSMTPGGIKALYDDAPLKTEKTGLNSTKITYKDVIAGYPATVTYNFLFSFLLFDVECVFKTEGLSIVERQEMAEKLNALLTPHFKPEQYDYFGFAQENPNNQVDWFFGSVFWTRNLWISSVGGTHIEDEGLSFIFMRQNMPLAFYSKSATKDVLAQIKNLRDKHGIFDYDKWRDIPTTNGNNE